ncbi:PP2C family protein-serine/threonine phosphatase [Streptomyces sp. NPDC058459]|uniref:PP2C family protein-serine/threonine phosphatase n=1 Tax=Streptomyces sp. NPDC058459 TaxID=3346508 RepID=UPI0036664965
MNTPAGPPHQAPGAWWQWLHQLWLNAMAVEDVTDIADQVYRALIQLPGAAVVVGARWDPRDPAYLRILPAGGADPVTWLPTAPGWPGGPGLPPSPEPGGAPRSRLYDMSGPDRADLTLVRGPLLDSWAAAVLECVFPLATGDTAGLWVGLEKVPDTVTAERLAEQLAQVADVLMASNERILAARAHERRQARDAFLAEASLQMDASLDVQETLGRVARLAVPAVAEGCAVHLFRPDGRLEPVAVAHVAVAAQERLAKIAHDDTWLDATLCAGAARRDGVLLRGADLAGGPFAPDAADSAFALSALSISPLRARGRTLGTLTFLYSGEDGGIADLRTLENLASRAALAIDTTTLYAQRREHVRLLQHHLLPRALPEVAGLELSAAYEVGDTSLDVGGDFYDVVAAGGRVALFIGDVCGRGAEAAAFTALSRHTLRTLLEDGTPPGPALSRLNRVLTDERASRFVTALVAVLTPAGTGWDAEIAAAGHPCPLLRRAGGEVTEVPAHGLLLGVVPGATYEPVRVRLGDGDAVLMFTDGLIEARSADGTHFEDHLPAAVRELANGDDPAARIVAAASAFRHLGDDDTAVLIARVKGQL